MHVDALGLALSCTSTEAAAAYVEAVDHQLHAWTGGLAAVQRALSLDPGFALAHAAHALMQVSRGNAQQASEAIALARENAATASAREQSHVALLAHLVQGRPAEALAAVEAHAERWPTDALAVSTALGAFGLFAFSGRADHDSARLAFTQRIAAHYPADHSWLLTSLAWAHIEAGALDVGEALVARSLQLRPANGNAAHVTMHAFFERKNPEAALAFIDPWLADYPGDAMLYGHLNWHGLVCHIDLANTDAALARLLRFIVPHLEVALPLVGFTDIASALWRLGLAGRSALPWGLAAQFAQRHYAQGGNTFVELHLAMLAAAQADRQALERCGSRLQRKADAGQAAALPALAWVAGLAALLDGDTSRARHQLQRCLDQAVRLGGSHAQRTVIERTLDSIPPPATVVR